MDGNPGTRWQRFCQGLENTRLFRWFGTTFIGRWYLNSTFHKWENTLNFKQTAAWVFLLIASAVLASWYPPAGAAVFVLILVIAMAKAGRHGRALKMLTTTAVIFSLIATQLPAQSTNGVTHANAHADKNGHSDTNAPPDDPNVVDCNIALGIVVLVVGAIIVWKLYWFCKQHFPPPPPPPAPPPPPPPPTPPPTNSPPYTNYPPVAGYFGSGVAANVASKDASTTSWPTFDNFPMGQASMATLATYANTNYPSPFYACDITSLNFWDSSVSSKHSQFTVFAHIPLAIAVSTNMVDWTTNYTISVWMSQDSQESIMYDETGRAIATNWCCFSPLSTNNTQGGTNGSIGWFQMYDPKAPRKFYRQIQGQQ